MGGLLLQNGKQAFTDANSRPLSGGRVFFYAPGTQTLRDTWQDAGLTVLNTNPVILDARGEASIYGNGDYRQVLRDASGVLIWDQLIPDTRKSDANNVMYTYPDGISRPLQSLAAQNDPLQGSAGIGDKAGTVYSSLRALEAGVDAVNAPGLTKQQNEYVLMSSFDDMGNVDCLNAAILSGTVTIAIAGDSIPEGRSQITYEDSVIGILRRQLIDQNKNLNINIVNYSLAGLSMPTLANLNYKGMAPPADPTIGFYRPAGGEADNVWPTGSVLDKAWLNHVRDANPDLFIIALGANDVQGDGFVYSNNMKLVISITKGWPKVPSIAIVPAALPSNLSPVGIPLQKAIQTVADAARGVAREMSCTVLDVNRRYLLMRDAVDICDKKYSQEDGFGGFPDGWTLSPGAAYSISTPGVLSGTGLVTRDIISEDIHNSTSFVIPNYVATTCGLFYRSQGATLRYSYFLVGGNSLQLYYNTTMIGSKALTASVPNGTTVVMEVRCEGAKHMMYLNGIYMFTVWDYLGLQPGKHGIIIDGGSGAIPLISVRLGNRYKVGKSQMSDIDIYGVNDWTTNPNSDGGNAINHPSKQGAINVWGAAFTPLLHHFRRIQDSGLVRTVRMKASDTVTAFDASPTQQVSVRVGGVEGPRSAVLVPVAGMAIATAETCQRVAGGSTPVVVDVFLTVSGVKLPINLTLGPGFWSVRAICTLSRNGSGYANNLSVEAINTP